MVYIRYSTHLRLISLGVGTAEVSIYVLPLLLGKGGGMNTNLWCCSAYPLSAYGLSWVFPHVSPLQSGLPYPQLVVTFWL